MKIIFCGTPSFAIASLKSLIASSHKILAVITQPDRPSGRGRKLQPSAVKKAAQVAGLPILQPERIGESESLAVLKQLKPDALAVVAYGQFLPKSILDLPAYGCINVHASLLPRYRGAAPINWAIIRGERKTGITTMLLDEGMDTGDMILRQSIKIAAQETAGTLHDKLSAMGAKLLIETLGQIETGTARFTAQDRSRASYAPLIHKDDCVIQWHYNAQTIDNFIRGLNPFPGARTFLDKNQLKVFKIEISQEDYPPGVIAATDSKRGLLVGTGSSAVWLKTIQPPNRSQMPAADYLAGLREVLTGKQLGGRA